MHSYQVYGLKVRSELNCPELLRASFSIPDIDVRFEPVSEQLQNCIFSCSNFDAGEAAILLRVPRVGRFLIENGRRIRIQPEAGVEQTKLRLFLLGSCLGAILHQRGITPLHASAVSCGAGAIVVCGRSGAGKSTTAAALAARGFGILADDISALSIRHRDVLLAPGYPQMKLWQNSMEYFRLPCRDNERVRPRVAKHAVRLEKDFEIDAKPVRAIFWLNKHGNGAAAVRELKGCACFQAIRKNIYRKRYNVPARKQRYFHQCRRLAERARVFELTRPECGNSIEAVADLVETLSLPRTVRELEYT